MSLITEIVDDFIDNKIGNGRVVTRQEVSKRYRGKYSKQYLELILSSSRFTQRVSKGAYKFDPKILERRKKERERS